MRTIPQLERLEVWVTQSPMLLCGREPDAGKIARKLYDDRNENWLVALSGLATFELRVRIDCAPQVQRCLCAEWPILRARVEDAIRTMVYQPRAPFGQSPKYLAFETQVRKEGARQRFLAERRKFMERMEQLMAHPERTALHRELLLRVSR